MHRCPSCIASSPARCRAGRRSCCFTAPAATRPICCRWGGQWHPARRSCRRAARCWRTACRASSAAWRRACSTRPTSCAAPMSSRTSSPRPGTLHLPAPVALGFSNGANIAAAMLLLRPEALAGAVLLRAMVPLAGSRRCRSRRQAGIAPLRRGGLIVPAANAARLASQLAQAGAMVRQEVLPAGHGLSHQDLAIAQDWLDRTYT